MAKITWLGEENLHRTVTHDGLTVESAGPSFTVAFGVKFPKGEAVEVTDKSIIERAKKNIFFKVQGTPGRPATVKQEPVNDDKDAE